MTLCANGDEWKEVELEDVAMDVSEAGSDYHERIGGSVCTLAGTRTCYIAQDYKVRPVVISLDLYSKLYTR